METKIYIGDGIYMEDMGYAFILTTENGISVQNYIHIEPSEWSAMERFVEARRKENEARTL